ncbi:MAG: cupin domain-containing protein [Bacteroidota bacterium]|nr:cupin domain-containing protein [Bacteroidota bacterium]
MEHDVSKISTKLNFDKQIEYSTGGIVSKIVLDKKIGNVSLFAFDKDQKLSEHTAPFDALIQIIEGEAEIFINHQPFKLIKGESIIIPANIPHAVIAIQKFKMLLTMIKSES